MSSKELLRKAISLRLQALEKAHIEESSFKVADRVKRNPAFLASKCLCIYLSMTKEIQTDPILSNCFSHNKQVLIPKVVGKQPSDMWMLPIQSVDQISSFPKSKWGIPEPPAEQFSAEHDMVGSGSIDLIFVPGVAFDANCGRLGHGKGYYDCFIERASLANESNGYPPPVTIGTESHPMILNPTNHLLNVSFSHCVRYRIRRANGG